MPLRLNRRLVLRGMGAAVAVIAFPALAGSREGLPRMTDGPFYPPLAYRARGIDWDADLTVVRGRSPDGQPRPHAAGEHLDLYGNVRDTDGRTVDGATVEIWQCDAYGSYHHPRGAGSRVDEGFQGFGSSVSDARGGYRFRTIRPVPYPGRTPHIHVKLRHPSFGEVTSQLFVAGEPGNANDILYKDLSEIERSTTELRLLRAPSVAGVAWLAERDLIVGA